MVEYATREWHNPEFLIGVFCRMMHWKKDVKPLLQRLQLPIEQCQSFDNGAALLHKYRNSPNFPTEELKQIIIARERQWKMSGQYGQSRLSREYALREEERTIREQALNAMHMMEGARATKFTIKWKVSIELSYRATNTPNTLCYGELQLYRYLPCNINILDITYRHSHLRGRMFPPAKCLIYRSKDIDIPAAHLLPFFHILPYCLTMMQCDLLPSELVDIICEYI